MQTRTCTWTLTLTPVVLAGVLPAVLVTALRDRLPAVVPGGGSGYRELSWTAIAAWPAVWMTLLAAATVFAMLRRFAPHRQAVWPALTWPIGALVLGWVASTILRNLDRVVPAPLPWWAGSPWAEIGLVLVAAAAWWAAGPAPQPPEAHSGPGPDAPRLDVAAHERAVWTRSVFSRGVLGVGTLMALVTALTWSDEGVGRLVSLWLVLLTASTLVAAWAQVRVADGRVTVRQPLLRRTLTGVELRHVVEARVRELDAGEIGALTYGVVDAGSTFGYRAVRRGDVLTLSTADGREFVVTVGDAATAAALVNTLLDRREGATGAGPDRSDVHRPAR